MSQINSTQPFDAGVVYVWSDVMVNLQVTDHAGKPHARTSVVLHQEDNPQPPSLPYAQWMPYQVGLANNILPKGPIKMPEGAVSTIHPDCATQRFQSMSSTEILPK